MAGDANARGRAIRGFIAVGRFLTRLAPAAEIRRRILEAVALCLCGSIPFTAFGTVGRTASSFDVSPTGAASYSIPIFTPPGTHGLAPRLALVYDLRNSSTLLGIGWGMAGLSLIIRCPRIWAADGEARDVRNDFSDRSCFDGNKLRLTAGTYGNPGATYQTEIETFSRATEDPRGWVEGESGTFIARSSLPRAVRLLCGSVDSGFQIDVAVRSSAGQSLSRIRPNVCPEGR